MKIAIIVVACLLGVGLIGFFIALAAAKYAMQRKHGAPKNAFFTNIKNWFIAHKPSKRRLIQLYTAVLFNANIKGYISGNIYTSKTTKYMCVPSLNCYSCPGAVGACPLGALQNSLATSGTRAPYYVLGILAIFGIMLGRTICGFLCPVGLCQELLYKVRTPKVKKSRVTRIFSYFKYVILALTIALPIIFGAFNIPLPAFCKYICPAGTLEGAGLLLANPNNADLFSQLGWQFTWKFALAIGLIVASVFIFRFFCRFICPLGAIYGFFNRYALIGVKVNDDTCIDCGLCIKHCKMDTKRVGDHECINCGECISVCPTNAISWKGSQIFLHKNATIDEKGPTVAPLAVANGTVKIAQNGFGSVALVNNADNGEATESSAVADINAQMSVCTPVTNNELNTTENRINDENTSKTVENRTPITSHEAELKTVEDRVDGFKPAVAVKNTKPKKPAKFWVEVTAWVLALALLVAALVCYNFVDVDKPAYTPPPETGYNVGDTAPDFTVNLYGAEGGEFNLYENRGKVTVVNFWGTWCTPCVKELPYFNELAANHPELSVVAIHGMITDNVQNYINKMGWNNWSVTFVQDDMSSGTALVYTMLGGKSNLYPMTVIIDEEGNVLYNSYNSFESTQQLETLISELLAKNDGGEGSEEA